MLSLHTANPKVRGALGFDGMFYAPIKPRLFQRFALNPWKWVSGLPERPVMDLLTGVTGDM